MSSGDKLSFEQWAESVNSLALRYGFSGPVIVEPNLDGIPWRAYYDSGYGTLEALREASQVGLL